MNFPEREQARPQVKDAIERAQNDARISSVEVTEQREQCERAQTLPSRDGTRCNQREQARPTVKDIFALRKQGKTAPASSVLASSAGEAGSPAYSAFRVSPAATVPAGSPAVPSAQVPAPSPALSGFSRLQCVPRFPRSHCARWFSSGAFRSSARPFACFQRFSRLQCVPRFPRSHCSCWFSSGAEPWPAGSSRLHPRESRPPRSDDI